MWLKNATAIHVQASWIFQVTLLEKGILESTRGVNLANRAARAIWKDKGSRLTLRDERQRPTKMLDGGERRMEDLAGRGCLARRLWICDSDVPVRFLSR